MSPHDPVPTQWSAAGCPAMVRRTVGQWESCVGAPAWVVIVAVRGVGRVRMFPCEAHRGLVAGARPMDDVDRADVAGRQVQRERALRGLRFESPGPVTDE